MTISRVALLVLGLLAFPVSAFAQSSVRGLTGLAEVRTPETIGENHNEIAITPARYSGQYGALEDQVGMSATLTRGLSKRLELGLRVPYYMYEKDSGVGNVAAAMKMGGIEPFSGLRIGANAEVEFPTASTSQEFGTGDLGLGAELLVAYRVASLEAGRIDLAGSAGYATADYCDRCTFRGDQLDEPRSVPAVRVGGSASFETTEGYIGFAQLLATKANNGLEGGDWEGDPDWYALAGARVPVLGDFDVTGYFGGGIGPQGTANTRLVGAVTLHYRFGGTPAQ